MPFELLWVVVVFGVNFALWGSAGSLRFAESVWQGRRSRVHAGPESMVATAVRHPGERRAFPDAGTDSTAGHRVEVQDVAVLIPAHDEEAVLGRTLDAVAKLVPRSNIYVVSDASTDRTVAIAAEHGASVIETPGKAGKAGALQEAIRRFQLVERYEAVLLLDADTHLDEDYFRYALPLFDDPEVVAVAGCAHTEWNPPGVSLLGRILITHRARIYAITQHLIKFGQTWRRTNALYIVPGFASMYRTRVLPHLDINPPGLVIEDFNMTFELYRLRLGRVGFTPRAQAVTQDPGTFGDYVRQTKRWALGFWQAVRRYRPSRGLFPVMLALYVTELVIASALIVLLPVIVILSILPTVIPGLLDVAPFDLVHAHMDLRLVVIAVLVPDLLLTIAVAILERRPRYLLFAPVFLPLRIADAAIALYALPRAWAERSTGSWISPERRRVIPTDDVQVIRPGALIGSGRYAMNVHRSPAVGSATVPIPRQLEGPPNWVYQAASGVDAHHDRTSRAVVRVTARVPAPYTAGEGRGVEPRRAEAHPIESRWDGGIPMPVPPMPSKDPGVAAGRIAATMVEQLRADAHSAAGANGTTIVIPEAVQAVAGVAARQISGVHYAHPDVSLRVVAPAREHGDDAAGASAGGQIAEVRIDLGIKYGFAVRTVTRTVRGAVILALRNLLDVDVASVDIVVREICFDQGASPADRASAEASREMSTVD